MQELEDTIINIRDRYCIVRLHEMSAELNFVNKNLCFHVRKKESFQLGESSSAWSGFITIITLSPS